MTTQDLSRRLLVQEVLDYKFADGAKIRRKSEDFSWMSYNIYNDFQAEYKGLEIPASTMKRVREELKLVLRGVIDVCTLEQYVQSPHMPFPEKALRNLLCVTKILDHYKQDEADASWRIVSGEQRSDEAYYGQELPSAAQRIFEEIAEQDASAACGYREIAKIIEKCLREPDVVISI